MKKIIIARSVLHAIGDYDTIFKRGNISTYIARTTEEILNVHGVRKADLIVTHATLPFMGGSKLCSAIRSDPDLKDVSIIMVCDRTEESSAQRREARANAVIEEPLDAVQLFSKISELLVIPQRKDLRVLLRVSVKGLDRDDSFFAASHNISISGMLLETERGLREGELLKCGFNIAHTEITAECVVVREEQIGPGRRRYGVKFVNLDTKSLVIIEQFVKAGLSSKNSL